MTHAAAAELLEVVDLEVRYWRDPRDQGHLVPRG